MADEPDVSLLEAFDTLSDDALYASSSGRALREQRLARMEATSHSFVPRREDHLSLASLDPSPQRELVLLDALHYHYRAKDFVMVMKHAGLELHKLSAPFSEGSFANTADKEEYKAVLQSLANNCLAQLACSKYHYSFKK